MRHLDAVLGHRAAFAQTRAVVGALRPRRLADFVAVSLACETAEALMSASSEDRQQAGAALVRSSCLAGGFPRACDDLLGIAVGRRMTVATLASDQVAGVTNMARNRAGRDWPAEALNLATADERGVCQRLREEVREALCSQWWGRIHDHTVLAALKRGDVLEAQGAAQAWESTFETYSTLAGELAGGAKAALTDARTKAMTEAKVVAGLLSHSQSRVRPQAEGGFVEWIKGLLARPVAPVAPSDVDAARDRAGTRADSALREYITAIAACGAALGTEDAVTYLRDTALPSVHAVVDGLIGVMREAEAQLEGQRLSFENYRNRAAGRALDLSPTCVAWARSLVSADRSVLALGQRWCAGLAASEEAGITAAVAVKRLTDGLHVHLKTLDLPLDDLVQRMPDELVVDLFLPLVRRQSLIVGHGEGQAASLPTIIGLPGGPGSPLDRRLTQLNILPTAAEVVVSPMGETIFALTHVAGLTLSQLPNVGDRWEHYLSLPERSANGPDRRQAFAVMPAKALLDSVVLSDESLLELLASGIALGRVGDTAPQNKAGGVFKLLPPGLAMPRDLRAAARAAAIRSWPTLGHTVAEAVECLRADVDGRGKIMRAKADLLSHGGREAFRACIQEAYRQAGVAWRRDPALTQAFERLIEEQAAVL
jgi:hypothetical protein